VDRSGPVGRVHRKQARKTGEGGIFLDVLPGLVGAMIGGCLFHIFGTSGVSGPNIYSLFVAVVGSVVCSSRITRFGESNQSELSQWAQLAVTVHGAQPTARAAILYGHRIPAFASETRQNTKRSKI
jgi:uncharacterized membrane protein YeaQ/YmgE (transglycosylase-associated protein family)